MNKLFSVVALLIVTLMSGCAQRGNDFVVTIKTPEGEMVAILYDETPKHKQNFIKLAKEHYYDSLSFHRVMEGFMIQGGDPDSRNAPAGQRLGMGGPGYTIDAEINPKLYHEKGALSAARLGDEQNPSRASSGSQFFIVQGIVIPEKNANDLRYDEYKLMTGLRQILLKPENKGLADSLNQLYMSGNAEAYHKMILDLAPRVEKETSLKVFKVVIPEKTHAYTTVGGTPALDGDYTVFGKVIKGLDVIDKIAVKPTDNNNRPLKDVRMVITVQEMPKSEIEKLYHYQYP